MQVRVRHMVRRRGRWFWQPTKKMKAAGFCSEALGIDKGKATVRAEALNADWDRVRKVGAPAAPKKGTVAWLADLYQKSPEYAALARKTRKEFDRLAEIVKAAFPVHVAAIRRRHIKGWWREQVAAVSLDHANRLVNKGLRPILRTAMDEELIAVNPVLKLKLTGTPPRQEVWTDEEIAAICKAGRPSIALAVLIGQNIGQRPTDILRLTWKQWDGRCILLQQGKTDTWVEVKATPALKTALDKAPRDAVQIIVNERTGRPYELTNFDARFRDARKDAGVLSAKQFMDLRRTCVVMLGKAGCTVPEIAAVTGHSIKTVEAILKVYLPRCSEIAANAIDKVVQWRTKVGAAS